MRLAILLAVSVCAAAGADLAAASGPQASLARFALIYPEADLTDESDDDDLQPNAVWLRRAAKKTSKSEAKARAKQKAAVSKAERPPATVAPLRRDRPKSEVGPAKSRRRALGW